MIQRLTLILLLCIAFSKTLAQHANLSTASKQLATFTIKAPQLDTDKKIWIYLPKNTIQLKRNIL